MDVVAILQARTASTRLPGKVLKPILGRPMILRQIERARRARSLDGLVVATSDDPSDDALAAMLGEAGVPVYRGSLDDVLDRFAGACGAHAPASRHVVRLTGDCPLLDPNILDATVARHREAGADYTSNCLHPSFPDGLDVEVLTRAALACAQAEARLPSEREHVTPFLWSRPERFRLAELFGQPDRSALRWTVDTPADLAFVAAVYAALLPGNPAFVTADVLALLEERPELSALNAGDRRNAGYAKSLAGDESLAVDKSLASDP